MGGIFNVDSPLMRGLSRVGDWIVLNFLTVLCGLPIITIGAAVTALYEALESLQKETGSNVKNYFHAFRANFKQTTVLWMAFLFSGLMIGYSLLVCDQIDTAAGIISGALLMLILFLWIMALSWVFPLQAKFRNSIGGTLKNAVLCALAYLPRSLCMAIMNIIPIFLLIFAPRTFMKYGWIWITLWWAAAGRCTLWLLQKPYAVLAEKGNSLEECKEM